MLPASDQTGAAKSRQLKRWGPIIGIVAVAAIVIGIVASSGDDKKTATPTTTTTAPAASTTASASTSAGATTTKGAPAPITYPLRFSEARAKGITVDWSKSCNTDLGQVKLPDYFAPECVAPFTGDNGGATAQGVTKDTIKIVYYQSQQGDPVISYVTDAIKNDDTNAQYEESMRGYIKMYESVVETYGRHVELTVVVGSGITTDPVAARADAVKIAEVDKPFMVWGGPALTDAFAEELAARKIPCIGCGPGQPQDVEAQRAPYALSITASAEQTQQHAVEYITKQLTGKPAAHAGDPALVSTTRKFGYVHLESSEAAKKLADQFSADMKAGGAELAVSIPYQLNPATIQETAASTIAKLKQAGVTSVLLNGDPVAPRDFTKEATAQGYFPEWILTGSVLVDTTAFSRSYDQKQWAHAFGLTTLSARTNPQTGGSYFLYKWFTGKEVPAKNSSGVIQPTPSVFYAGLQLAGPNLTAQSFQDGFFNAPPTKPGISVPGFSFGDKGIWKATDYNGIDDATVMWWDATATGEDEIRRTGTGMWTYIDGGKRYLPGAWPSVDKAFVKEGAVTIYENRPPGEEPPVYPSPAAG